MLRKTGTDDMTENKREYAKMKIKFYHGLKLCAVLAAMLLVVTGCGSSGGGATATDDGGGGGVSDTVSIAISPTDLAAITLVAAQNSINPEEETPLTATAYNASGGKVAGVVLFFTLDDPTLGSVTETAITGDDGTAPNVFTASNTAGTATITARTGSVSGTVDITISQTYVIALSSNATTVAAGGGTATVTATVTDDGAPVSGATITFQVAAAEGSLSTTSTVTDAAGMASTVFTASDTDTAGTATITARTDSVSDTIDISITVSPPPTTDLAAIALVAAQSSINPEEQTTLTAMGYNASGRAVSGAALVFTVDQPTLGYVTETATTGADGTATVTFTGRTNPGTVNVTATSGSVSSSPRSITILDQTTPANIVLSASATSVSVTKTLNITATVTDGTGALVANGTTVSFEVTTPTYGSITASGVTNAGVASATFTASSNPGTATISASSGSATDTIDITVSPAAAANISFVSTSLNPIAIRSSGGTEYAIITFEVKDANGNPTQDVDVLFTMSGPGGGEYIEENDATPTVHTVGTTNGVATVTLYSGTVPGTVSLNASITTAGGDTITATTPVISIGGGVPSDKRLSVSAERRNLPGWTIDNEQTDITVYLADRYGNYNVLAGQSVSFECEAGLAIYSTGTTDPNATLSDKDGTATVTLRTQPVDETFGTPCEDVTIEAEETAKITDINGRYDDVYPGFDLGGHPRNGLCAVLAYTKGEEHFEDGSAGYPKNGLYEIGPPGENFTDTADDPFCDYNDDGAWEDGTGADPFEDLFKDVDLDGWSGVNGAWDSNKYIFRNYQFLISGEPGVYYYIEDQDGDGINDERFAIEASGSVDVNNDGDFDDTTAVVHFLICDANYNPPCSGSSFSVTVTNGLKVVGNTSLTYPDIGAPGSTIEFIVTITTGTDMTWGAAACDIEFNWVTTQGTTPIPLSISGAVN